MVKLLLLFLLITNSLFALSNDLVQVYRTQGFDAVKKILEAQLAKKEYWDYHLSNQDISNGYYESIQYVMICQKDMQDIVLYDTKKKQKLFSSSVFTGKVSGDKKVEGDLKTPVGAYQLTNKLTKLDPFYGPLALTTNYPNRFDRANGKTGHGIWIHGLPEDEKRDEFTQGCIALDNDKIKKLSSSINFKNSVLVISEGKFNNASKEDIASILSNVFKWRDAWKKSDLKTYLSFYDKSFKKSNGQTLKKFKAHKKRIFAKKEKKIIQFKNINVIPYPNDLGKTLYKVIMDEEYRTKNYQFIGKKELYVEIKNNQFKILTES